MQNNNNSKQKPRRKYLIEVMEEKPKCLLVYQKNNRFIETYEEKISQTHTIYQTSSSEENWTDFDLVVFFGILPELSELKNVKKLFLIFFNQKEEYQIAQNWLHKNHQAFKVVNLGKTNRTINELVEMVIFKTPIPYYFNFAQKVAKQPWVKITNDPKKNLWLSLKIILGTVLFLNVLFLISFVGELWLFYDLYRVRNQNTSVLTHKIAVLKQTAMLNAGLLEIPKNTLFWLPGIEIYLGLANATDSTTSILVTGSDLLENFTTISALVTKQNKTPNEVAETKLRVNKLKQQIKNLTNDYYQTLSLWEQTNVPFFNTKKQTLLSKAREAEEYLLVADKMADKLPYLLGANEERRYLILFMNNMELRPGGGFIGSLASVKMNKYSLKELEVYDVYTLDGQLKAHIDPPEAIVKHLNQPHWFLRDSNFSPDFSASATQALKFIKMETEWPDFDAVFGITLTTVQRLLSLFPDFYLDDYSEHITSDNFFIKAQSYAERDFFPGSYGKKDFLQSVFKTLILKIEQGEYDYWRLTFLMRDLFEEKFTVAYFKNPLLQQTFDELFWTGRVVSTECNFKQNCFSDYMYVVDANLGINKANFYVQRTIRLNTEITPDRTVKNSLALDYYNQSSSGVFPGGDYKNYIQVFLPKNTIVNRILIEGQPATDYDVSTELGLRKIGFLTTVASGNKVNITLEYEFIDKLQEKEQYQLIVQKQIGSINNDFIWRATTPPGLSLAQSNFTPIVRSDGFVYNTFLQQDRILIVDFK